MVQQLCNLGSTSMDRQMQKYTDPFTSSINAEIKTAEVGQDNQIDIFWYLDVNSPLVEELSPFHW